MALNLSREETIANHRKMWNWIADETLKRKRRVLKEEYFIEHGIPENRIPAYNCYCCDYDKIRGDCCEACLIKWDKHKHCVSICLCSIYGEWKNRYNNYQEAALLARQIANLPERI